jgi:large subunit ribosomal protein L25
MSQDVQLQAEKREELGKNAVAALRAAGKVPGVVQEHGKESISILVDGQAMLKANELAGKSQPIDLSIGGTKVLALIKEIEFVPLKPRVQHVVFQALNRNEVVDAEVPVHIIGDVPAEQNRLAVLHTLEMLQVRALPKDLPEALEVSADALVNVDDRIDIKDIKLPEGVELVELLAIGDDEEKREEFLSQPIAIVKEPQVEEEPEEEVAEGADAEVPSEHGSPETSEDGEEAKE